MLWVGLGTVRVSPCDLLGLGGKGSVLTGEGALPSRPLTAGSHEPRIFSYDSCLFTSRHCSRCWERVVRRTEAFRKLPFQHREEISSYVPGCLGATRGLKATVRTDGKGVGDSAPV